MVVVVVMLVVTSISCGLCSFCFTFTAALMYSTVARYLVHYIALLRCFTATCRFCTPSMHETLQLQHGKLCCQL